MPAPVAKLKKKEIVWLSTHRCEAHRHRYLDHYNCYLEERPDLAQERIGFFDLEASNLSADYGQVLSWCIKDSLSNEVLYGLISKEDLEFSLPGEADKRIVREFVHSLPLFDKLVTFYGARFDLPFIRTRAQICGVEFPNYGTLNHKDLWFVIRGKYKLSSNRLENACRVLLGHTNKTRIEPKHWHGALQGNQASLDYILDHNKKDCWDLEELYNAVIDVSRPQCGSI